ncbi:MAG TPA: prepilin-type N-terminal cleavage/methylation domain-containing protein, partial [Candidatus Methylacidiphilales bacterium]
MNAFFRPSARPGSRAFSLIEVMLALGIAAFCLLSLILLLPVGMSANQSSIGKTVGTGLATEIANQLQSAASYYSVSNATPAGSLFTLPGRGQGTGEAGTMNTLFYD